MAYAAVVSLKQTIEHLRSSRNISILPSSVQIIESAYEELRSIQKLLQGLDIRSGLIEKSDYTDLITSYEPSGLNKVFTTLKRGKSSESRGFRGGDVHRMNALDGKMREAASELEDALENHVVNLILKSRPSSLISLDLQELKPDIDFFNKTVKELKKEYAKEEDDDDVVSSRINFGGNKSKMVGFSDEFRQMKDELLEDILRVNIGSVVGMAGIGKTTIAKEFFEDSSVLNWFDHRAWVTVGPKYQLIDIMQNILDQVDPYNNGKMLIKGDELALCLRRSLKDRRCLVVLDDVWNKEITFYVERLIVYACFGYKCGSLILLTTRTEKVGATDSRLTIKMLKLRFLTNDESWDLLREKVFGEESCPSELEKAGKKIAENCEGLPLTIVTISDFLIKAEKTPEYWNMVAEKENSIFIDAYDQMSKVLLRSYNYLPQYLKDFFLYMGVFPQKYDIPLSKLTKLWSVEGCFLSRASKHIRNLEVYLLKHLEELVGKNLVLVRKRNYKYKPKTYGLHSALWHSCIGEAERNKFFHVFNNYADSLVAESIRNQRRLCIHNNILFGIKDVQISMASISTARSLLCTGPHHRYPIPICFGLRLLRVIDALTIRFYEFPMDVLELVQLKYLALTCDGKLPISISKLSNLQILIVRRYFNIVKLYEDESYLPMEIWDMKELEHLQVMGGNLPDPCDGAVLPNLITLLDVSAHSCTKGVIKGLPKLNKLGIRIEFSVDVAEPLCCFDHISHLNKLESLKCVVVNPALRSEVVAPLASSSLFPKSIKKLSLRGLGFSWEDMKVIASLPKLEVLKLRCYAFRGPKWEVLNKGFPSLEFLLIKDTDLVYWTIGHESFSKLQCLSLKQCYKLQDIQWKFRKSLKIEIVDCNPLTVTCAKQMQKNRSNLEVNVHSSWDDEKLVKA
ncbi:hypothetical protein DH2020_042833 [Rehmannia glutinosa]|uniref:NB-ARC domain-containing protein n=1 Tax=Rehmannia glutinosa TaxID=99300 RepID=A0ABR0ULB8_REHGL